MWARVIQDEKLKIQHRLKNCAKLALRKTFEIFQKINLNILPCHFYSEIPNFRELRKDESWRKPCSMIGVQGTEIINQLNFIKECCTSGLMEKLKEKSIYTDCCEKNGEGGGYGPIEADFLYCFICTKRPKRIIQIGCGVSTAVMMSAAAESGYLPEIICIEPYPTDFLIESNKKGKIKLIHNRAQTVDINILTDLNCNDLLFIDSTHTVKTGSEVNMLILEILSRLKKGTWVHFHDILFPYDYSRHFLSRELFFSNESVLLHSFLINNYKYMLRAALSMLHYADPKGLKNLITNYCPSDNYYGLSISEGHFPSSAYLEVVED